MTTSPNQLANLLKLTEAATELIWCHNIGNANSDFYNAARTALPELIADYKALQAELAERKSRHEACEKQACAAAEHFAAALQSARAEMRERCAIQATSDKTLFNAAQAVETNIHQQIGGNAVRVAAGDNIFIAAAPIASAALEVFEAAIRLPDTPELDDV